MRARGNIDLVADLSVERGWEEGTVVVVDCNKGTGVENFYMRAVGNIYVVKTEKRQDRTEEEEEELFIDCKLYILSLLGLLVNI